MHPAVDAAEVEQVGRERHEPMRLPQRAVGAAARLGPVAEVLGEQLEAALQRGQRGAQLVRGDGQELLAVGLLAQEPAAHVLERAGDLADLVADVVHGDRVLEALVVQGARVVAQPPHAAQHAAGGERGEDAAGEQPDDGGERQRAADGRGGRPRVAQRLADDERHVLAATGPRARADDRVVADDALAHVVAAGQRRGPRARPLAGIRVGQDPAVGAEQRDLAARPAAQLADHAPRAGRARAQAVAGQLADVEARGARELAQLAELVALEPVLQRRQEGEGRGDQRRDARPDHGQDEPRAQAPRPQAHAASRYPAPRTVAIAAGSPPASVSFSRRWCTWTSIARGSRNASSPKIARTSSTRERTPPAACMSASSTANSDGVSAQLGALPADRPRVGIQLERAAAQRAALDGGDREAPERGAHPAAQLGDADGLADVVVRAGLERQHDVGLVAARGEDHDERLDVRRAQTAAHADAVRPAGAEAEVEEHELVALGRERVERRLAVGHRADVVALGEQRAGQDVPEVVVVLDEQDARAHGGGAR